MVILKFIYNLFYKYFFIQQFSAAQNQKSNELNSVNQNDYEEDNGGGEVVTMVVVMWWWR